VGHAQALEFEFPDHEETVVGPSVCSGPIAKIDDAGAGMACFTRFVPPFDGHAAADETVELPVVLQERPGKVHAGELFDGLLKGRRRQVRVEPCQGRPEIPNQDRLLRRCSPQGPLRPEGFGVVSINTFPAEVIMQVVGKGLLNQSVFAVDVGDHGLSPDEVSYILHDLEGPLQIEFP